MQVIKESSIIVNRLKKNLKQRKSILKNGKTTAYRIYEKDIPEYPYIVDIYNDFAVVYEKGKRADSNDSEEIKLHQLHKSELIDALGSVLNINCEKVIFKTRLKQKGKNQYNKISKTGEFIIVQENHMKFRVNLLDYLDTGLFLDHRPLREIINQSAQNQKVLNLFSYTGSISIAAALGGGVVTTIDMSNTYIQWAKDNFNLNELSVDKHEFIQADVIQYIDNDLRNQFDLIILDPPSFSNSKRMDDVFDVQRDHEKMILKLMSKLSENGVLYFSNNNRKFSLSQKVEEQFKVKDISLQSIPKDFRDTKIHVCYKIEHKKSL